MSRRTKSSGKQVFLDIGVPQNFLKPIPAYTEHGFHPINGKSYRLNQCLNCMDGGIYAISCACTALYTGKTTTAFNKRFCEHFRSSNSAVFDHSKHCQVGKKRENFSIQFLENVQSRGKYSLSEREYLWNSRLRGIVNIQKTLLS